MANWQVQSKRQMKSEDTDLSGEVIALLSSNVFFFFFSLSLCHFRLYLHSGLWIFLLLPFRLAFPSRFSSSSFCLPSFISSLILPLWEIICQSLQFILTTHSRGCQRKITACIHADARCSGALACVYFHCHPWLKAPPLPTLGY